MITNPYSAEERLQAMISAAFRATRAHFSHLPLRYLIDPPHDLPDARLARQVAIHVLRIRFEVPRSRLATTMGRGRVALRQAVLAIENRCQEPVFERAYERIATRAMELFEQDMAEAAAADEEAA